MTKELNVLGTQIIGLAINVHQALGPGLLESSYEACLEYELRKAGLLVERQKPLPLIYKTVKVDCGYRLDLLVEKSIIIELKAIDRFAPIHTAQLITYLKLTNCRLGYLLNFNVSYLKMGIKRCVL